jgi:ferrochelatase
MKAVLLANMGAPVSEKGMKVFLKRMFSDKAILYAPAFVRSVVSTLLSNVRYKSSWKKYLQINGSPLQRSMEKMASDLQQLLSNEYIVNAVYSYSEPFIEEKIAELYRQGIREMWVISMYPQASYSTTGSVQTSLDKMQNKYNDIRFRFIEDYFDNELFIDYWKKLISDKIAEMKYTQPYLLFSSHAIPRSFIDRGDLYTEKMNTSARLISESLGWKYSLSYQSKIGPIEWTKPYTSDYLKELSKKGIDEIIVVPLSFINENLETRYDLDTELIPYGLNTLGIKNICRITLPDSSPYLVKMFREFINSYELQVK